MTFPVKAAIALFILLTSAPAFAGDAQYWQTFGVEGKIFKDLSLHVSEELRFSNNMSHFYYAQTDIGLIYKITNFFRFGGVYRQVFEDRGYDVDETFDTWRKENRPIINFIFDLKTKHVTISDRNQFEFRFIDGSPFNVRYRNRLTVEVPFDLGATSLAPFLADEIFININAGKMNINRFYSGLKFKFADNYSAELYYLLQSSKKTDGWSNFNTLGCRVGVIF